MDKLIVFHKLIGLSRACSTNLYSTQLCLVLGAYVSVTKKDHFRVNEVGGVHGVEFK